MAAVSRRVSSIPQPVTSRGLSRQGASQRSPSRPRREDETVPTPKPPSPDRPSSPPSVGSSPSSPSHEQAALESPSPPATAGSEPASPSRRAAAPRSPGADSACSQRSQMSSLSSSLSMNSSLGPGKVRAMFQARRMGGSSAQNSPVGWDKSYPLEPIAKESPPAGGRQKRTPPARSGAGRRAERPPPQKTVSGAKGKGAPLRRAKSHSSIESPPQQQRRAAKPAARSSSVGRTKRKPPRRQEDRNRINAEMRRREGELLDKIKDTPQQPAGLKARQPRRSKSKSPAPPKPAAKPSRKTLSPAASKKPAGSRRASFNAGSRRASVKAAEAPRPPPTDPNMAQCPICTRSFAKDRLEKHQEICEKSAAKKRKVFDPVKMRVQGTESEQYIKKIKQGGDHNEKSPKKADWRKQHEEFVSNIRAAKQAQAHVEAGGSLADLPPPPPSENPDYVQCPHCERRFNETAAERHIPKCTSINKGPPGKQGGKGGRGRR